MSEPGAVATLLGVAARGDETLDRLDAGDIAGMTFVCAGHLLAWYSLEGQKWWDYLNEIWAAAEAEE
jgi:hypothetical protein